VSEQLTNEERVAGGLGPQRAYELCAVAGRALERGIEHCCDRGLGEPCDAQELGGGFVMEVGQQLRQ